MAAVACGRSFMRKLIADKVECPSTPRDSHDQERAEHASFARWCYRHRLIVVIAWLVILATVIGVDRSPGATPTPTPSTLPGTESAKALQPAQRGAAKQSGDSDSIVWHVPSGSVNDPAVRTRITASVTASRQVPVGRRVTSPYTPTGAVQISRDGKTAYATIVFTKLAAELPGRTSSA